MTVLTQGCGPGCWQMAQRGQGTCKAEAGTTDTNTMSHVSTRLPQDCLQRQRKTTVNQKVLNAVAEEEETKLNRKPQAEIKDAGAALTFMNNTKK